MKSIIFSFLSFAAAWCNGASVVFGEAYVFDRGNGQYTLSCDLDGHCGLFFDVLVTPVTESGYLSRYFALTFEIREPTSPLNLVAAKVGDVVSASTVRNLSYDKYLLHYKMDDGGHVGGQNVITVDAWNEKAHLAFACSDEWYPDHNIYGWMDIFIDWRTGGFTAENIIMEYDLDGGSMVVGGGAWEGGIPEPSGGVLFLLGAAALGLRRVRELKS